MAHPFFEQEKYPLHRPGAVALLELLPHVIERPRHIDLTYRMCKENLPPLDLNQPADVIWSEALQNLTSRGALQKLCELILKDYPNNTHIQNVVLAVVHAKPNRNHPFFDTTKYPMHRSEGVAFLETLSQAIRNPDQIRILYLQSGGQRFHNLAQPTNTLWFEVLQNLTAEGVLERFCDHIMKEFPQSQYIQKAVGDVLNAKPSSGERVVRTDGFYEAMRVLMENAFSLDDLEALCFDLDINYENISGDNLRAKSVGILKDFKRNLRVIDLVEYCRRQRPQYTWPEPPKAEKSF